MPPRPLPTRSRALRPTLDGLETRALLSRMTSPAAMIAALGARTPRGMAVPIINQLATAPMQTVSTVIFRILWIFHLKDRCGSTLVSTTMR